MFLRGLAADRKHVPEAFNDVPGVVGAAVIDNAKLPSQPIGDRHCGRGAQHRGQLRGAVACADDDGDLQRRGIAVYRHGNPLVIEPCAANGFATTG